MLKIWFSNFISMKAHQYIYIPYKELLNSKDFETILDVEVPLCNKLDMEIQQTAGCA